MRLQLIKMLGYLFAILLILLMLLTGCSKHIHEAANTPAPLDEPIELTEFIYSHNGMSTDSCYSYGAQKTDDGTRLNIELYSGNHIIDVVIQEDILEQLGKIAARYRLDLWDGFNKTNSNVMDGEGFGLSMITASGQTIRAYGSNSFPTGYWGAGQEITALFNDLIYRYGDLWPKTLESDNLNYIMLSFAGENGFNSKFFFSAYEQNDGMTKIDIQINRYDVLSPETSYNFFGYCEDFPFAEIQSIIRKYDIPSWNGWDKTAENYQEHEWFQLECGYESDESISAMGTLHPEHYDDARNELLEMLMIFIRENGSSFIPWEG